MISVGQEKSCVEFVKRYPELFKDNNFKEIYKKAFNEVDVPVLTEWLYDKNIDPLVYMNYIPQAFSAMSKIREYEVSPHIKVIEKEAFWLCVALSKVTLPVGLTDIGESAFGQCNRLKEIIFPDTLKSIGKYAFNTTGLEQILIPESVTIIGREAFEECKHLIDVTIMGKLTIIEPEAFYNCNKNLIIYCKDNSNAKQYCEVNGIQFRIIK